MFDRLGAELERTVDERGANGLALAAAKFFPGGLPTLLDRLREAGHGAAIDSWIGTGPNAHLPADAFARLLTPRITEALAWELTIRPERVAAALAQFLPAAVDRESPDGRLREQPQFSTQIGDDDSERTVPPQAAEPVAA